MQETPQGGILLEETDWNTQNSQSEILGEEEWLVNMGVD